MNRISNRFIFQLEVFDTDMFNIEKVYSKQFLFALAIRIPLIFIQLCTWECEDISKTANLYINSGNILFYEAFNDINSFTYFPPLTFYFCYLIFLFIGNGQSYYYFAFKILWIIFDFANFLVLYKIAELLFKSKEMRGLYCFSVMFCPFMFLLTSLRGLNEAMTLFFILTSIYYFFKNKYSLSYIFMSFGFVHTIVPIILIIPYFLYLINRERGFYKFMIAIPITATISIIISIPYLLLIPERYVRDLLTMFSRTEYSMSFGNVFFPAFFESLIWKIDFPPIFIEITFFHLLILAIFSSVFFYFAFSYKIISQEDLIICVLVFLILMPILSRSFHFRQFFWLYPLYNIFVFKMGSFRYKFRKQYRKKLEKYIYLNFIINFLILILIIFTFGNPFNQKLPREFLNIILLFYSLLWCFLWLNLGFIYEFLFNLWYLVYSIYFLLLLFSHLLPINAELINLRYLIFFLPTSIFLIHRILLIGYKERELKS